MLSNRSNLAFFGPPEFLLTKATTANSDLYDPDTNPKGYVNLGTAVNALCETEIQDYLTQDGIFEHQKEWQHYYELRFVLKRSNLLKSISKAVRKLN